MVCLCPYIVLDYMLVIPPLVSYVFPLGSFVGMIPYIFFRLDYPIIIIKYNYNLYLYYLLLVSAIGLQTYIILQVLKNRIYKIYKMIILHHFSVGLFYLVHLTIYPLILYRNNLHLLMEHEANLLVILLGMYGFLLNILAVVSLTKDTRSDIYEM